MVNLQGLINEVLEMAKRNQSQQLLPDEQDYREYKKRQFLADQDYWSEIRKRNTALETGQQTIAGNTELEGIKNAGSMARQRLMEDTNRMKATNEYNADIFRSGANIFKTKSDYAIDARKQQFEELNPKSKNAEEFKFLSEVIKTAGAGTPEYNDALARAKTLMGQPQAQPEPRKGLGAEQPGGAVIPETVTRGSEFTGKNQPTDFDTFRTPRGASSVPSGDKIPGRSIQSTTPSIPATGFGGSVGRGWYGFTHPDEPIPFQGAQSPLRKGLDQTVFTDAPQVVANTARGAVQGVQDFGRNAALGYEQRKAEEEAKKKRKALY